MKMDSNFHTEWSLTWSKNYQDFDRTNELMCYTNLRGPVCEAQRQFEMHLSEVMNHGSHQPLY